MTEQNIELQPKNMAETAQPSQMVSQGFRLAQLEIFNWGTFDGKIWQLTPQQDNALLTGNIGSGKSTLVDGLTTLLVPPRKLAFNKAAGPVKKNVHWSRIFTVFIPHSKTKQVKRAR